MCSCAMLCYLIVGPVGPIVLVQPKVVAFQNMSFPVFILSLCSANAGLYTEMFLCFRFPSVPKKNVRP